MEPGVPSFALLLPNETSQLLPEEVLVCLADYLHEIGGNRYLLCSEIGVQWPFVHVTALKNDYSNKAWKIQLPVQYVLAMVDLSDKEALPIGFQKKTGT